MPRPPSAPDARLVPSSAAEFRSPAFWDGFFEARGDAAFEWYGDWASLRPLLLPLCGGGGGGKSATGARVLVLGCGNSELSAHMYDDGVTDIVNVDFCASVIRSMLLAHARARPRMRWRVADVTSLAPPAFPDASFDLLVDKGGLDALHSDADDGDGGGAAAAAGMLGCVKRVTAEGGAYACVTLAQPHVLAALLAAFRGPGWTVAIDAPPPSPDMAGAPLQPLVVIARRAEGGAGAASPASPLPPVACRVVASITSPNADQLAGVAAVVAAENAARAAGKGVHHAPPTPAPPSSSAAAADADPYAALHPGRTTALTLPVGAAAPAYHVTVIDAPSAASPAASPPSAAVFVVPLARDADWLFTSAAGLATVAEQVGTGRVIIVRLARGIAHGALDAVRAALSPHVAPLAPAPLRGVPGAVPIVTAGGEGGFGERAAVARVPSDVTGCDLLVEDVSPPPPSAPPAVVGLRQLVFGGAAGLVQSEAVLVAGGGGAAAGAATTGAPRCGRGGKAKPLPPPPPSVALADHLPAAYHAAVLAGLALAGGDGGGAPLPLARGAPILIVGLGGGGLAAALAAHAGARVTAVELDPAVVGVARQHFGLAVAKADADGAVRVVVGDGVAAVVAAAPASFAAIVVDAGGGSAGEAMTCPPAPFTTRAFAAAARAALAPGGALVVNAVSRDPAPVADLIATLATEFVGGGGREGGGGGGVVVEVDVPDDVNRVLVALPSSPSPSSARLPPGADVAARLPPALRDPGRVVGGPTVAELADLAVVRA